MADSNAVMVPLQVGTFAWAAPEVLLGRPCTEKVDIYSFGVMLWELSAGEAPPGRHLRPLRCCWAHSFRWNDGRC